MEKKAGGSIHDTQIVKGIVLDKEIVHSGMPSKVEGAKIALVDTALEIEKTEMSSEIRITDPGPDADVPGGGEPHAKGDD